jgi:hypothetical protein
VGTVGPGFDRSVETVILGGGGPSEESGELGASGGAGEGYFGGGHGHLFIVFDNDLINISTAD